jgi:WD40 repeat protein/uncharacterized caspase-like protein
MIFRPLARLPLLFLLLCVGASAQRPELVVQTGHTAFVSAVVFSPDGQTLASSSWDGTIKLWDVSTGREWRTLRGHTGQVRAVTFSPDGRMLASGGEDGTVRLWDIATGRVVLTLSGHRTTVATVAFSHDGRLLASGSADKTIKIWDASSAQVLRTLTGHSDGVNSIAFSPDGQTLASGSDDQTLRLWQVTTGAERRVLRGHTASITSVAFSPDGQVLASGSEDKTIKLWQAATGRELRVLKGHTGQVSSVAFNPDGLTLASAGWDKTIRLWQVTTGRELRTLGPLPKLPSTVAFDASGQVLANGSWGDLDIRLWDVRRGQPLRLLAGRTGPVEALAFSPDGKTMASGNWYEKIRLWSLSGNTNLRALDGHEQIVKSLAFSPDSQTLASGSMDKTVKLWDVATGRELRTLKGHAYQVTSVAFSPDGRLLASVGDDKAIKLWEVATGREVRALPGLNSVAFSPDGQLLASVGEDNAVRLWRVATGELVHEFAGHTDEVFTLAFSPDGQKLASRGHDDKVILWDVSKGEALGYFEAPAEYISTLAFSHDGRWLACPITDNLIKLWDLRAGGHRTLAGHAELVRALAFSADDKLLVSAGDDAQMKVWDVPMGAELVSLCVVGANDWVAATPDGLFDGSPPAWHQLFWRFEQQTFNVAPVEAFFNEFYYPGLLEEFFRGRRPRADADIAQRDRRLPQVQLQLAAATTTARTATRRNAVVRLTVAEAPADKAHQTGGGAQDLRLFRNGSLVKVWHGDVLQGQRSVTLETTIPIVAGANTLTAYAFNRDNIKSADATALVTGAASLRRKGTAYVIAVGVNQYAPNPFFHNLKYAVADAEEFAVEVKRQQEQLAQYEQVEVVSLMDAAATKAHVLGALSELAKKAQPEDAVLVYFAGHGLAAGGRFYVIPHDIGADSAAQQASDRAALDAALGARGISDRELEQAFERVDAGQLTMIIDACNSGQALGDEKEGRGPMNSKGLAQLAYDKGMYILTAAQSFQAAQEAAQVGHGLLTFALIEEGLKQALADDEPKDGAVLVREWLDYATSRVPQMQVAKMKTARGLGLDLSFNDGERGLDMPQRSGQRPRVFYRRELETQPLVIAKPAARPIKHKATL